MTTKTDSFLVTQNPLTTPWALGMAAGCRAAGAGAYATAAVNHSSIWDTADYTCTADQRVTITLNSLSVYDFPGVALRFAATGGGVGYVIYYNNNAGTVEVKRWAAGAVAATIASFAATFANGDTLGGEIIGTTIKVYQNGAQIGANYTDAIVAGGQFGIFYFFGGIAGTRITQFTGVDGVTAGPNVTGTSSANPPNSSALTITGTAFGAVQGAGGVTIGGIAQAVTAWADTSITVTVARGTNKYGIAVNVVVTDNGGTPSGAYALTSLQPQTGWSFINLVTPNATSAYRITAVGDLVATDQLAYDNQGGDVTVYNDATWSADLSVTSFNVEAWSSTGGGWGATGLQSIGAAPTPSLSGSVMDLATIRRLLRRY